MPECQTLPPLARVQTIHQKSHDQCEETTGEGKVLEWIVQVVVAWCSFRGLSIASANNSKFVALCLCNRRGPSATRVFVGNLVLVSGAVLCTVLYKVRNTGHYRSDDVWTTSELSSQIHRIYEIATCVSQLLH